MKTPFIAHAFTVVVLGAMLSFAAPAFGDDAAPASAGMLSQAFDLVHQAWNPGGDPPSAADRTDLLTKALKLAQEAPDHHLRGHRVQAILDIKAALAELKDGDPDHKADGLIHDAAEELRTAISIAD